MHAAWANSPMATAIGSKFRLLSTLAMIGASRRTFAIEFACVCTLLVVWSPWSGPTIAPPQPKIRVPSLITDIDHCPPSSIRKLNLIGLRWAIEQSETTGRSWDGGESCAVICSGSFELCWAKGRQVEACWTRDTTWRQNPFLISHSCSGILSLGMECCEQVSQSSRCVHSGLSVVQP